MNGIEYSKLEEILQKVGYSDSQISAFRMTFVETFYRKIGVMLDSCITEEQKDEIENLLSEKQVTVGEVVEYFEKAGFKAEITLISQKVFEEMVFDILEKMVEIASDDQREIIRRSLSY